MREREGEGEGEKGEGGKHISSLTDYTCDEWFEVCRPFWVSCQFVHC